MNTEIIFFIVKLLVLYIILGFFPGVMLEFKVDESANIMGEYIRHFFHNFTYLWQLKCIGTIVLAIASIKVKKSKDNKYKNIGK